MVQPFDERKRLRTLEETAIGHMLPTQHVGLLYGLLCLFVVLVSARVSFDLTAIWSGAYLAYVAIRAIAYRRLVRQASQDAPLPRIRAFSRLSCAGLGLLVGSLAVLAMPQMDLAGRIALTVAVILFCSVAAVWSSTFTDALLVLNVLVSVPFAGAWAVLASPFRLAALPLLAFPVVAAFIGRRASQAAERNWRLVIKNEDLAEELRRANRDMAELDRSRNRLFAVAGHDLRQPVHSMGLAIAQLNEYAPPQTLRQQFNQLQESTDLVAAMLQDLMDLSSMERESYEVRREAVALAPLIEQLRFSQEGMVGRKGLLLQVEPIEPGLAVFSDPNLLRRMLLNLISNAIKYTMEGQVTVQCLRAGEQVVIRVKDTGIGIPPEYLHDIFEDYVRVDSVRRKEEGLGLGLSVVKRAADLLGHELAVQSQLGEGSIFEVRAAAAQLDLANVSQPVATGAVGAAISSEGADAGETIVLVEDDDFARKALAGLLAQWGLDVVAAASGTEALALLAPGQTPSLAIADLQLSVHETGFDAIEAIRRRAGDMQLPALLLTGDVRPALIPHATGLGIKVAHKPVPPPLLKQTVLALLQRADGG